MSGKRSFETEFQGTDRWSRWGAVVFGDRVSLAVGLAATLLFTVFWVVDWRITDSITLLNTLAGMSDGHLHISGVEYGSNIDTPGTFRIGDRIFGRNYGILTVSLVPLAILEVLAIVVDLRIAIAGLFSLTVLALALVVGRILDRERSAARVGSALALVLFAGNVALATDLDPTRTELYALQITHLVAGAVIVVLAYRLLAVMHGKREGLFAAAIVALATPVGLWATIPKRHVFTAGLAILLAFVLYRSRVREAGTPGTGRYYRAGAYAAIALFAWVHAAEALVCLLVFAAVDLPTARNDRRSLAVIGAATVIATIPFLVTNYLISGSSVTPPRMLLGSGAATGGSSAGGSAGGGGGLLAPLFQTLDPMLTPLATLLGMFVGSLTDLITKPDEILSTFVRSGYLGGRASELANYESVNLAVLESAPVLAATLGVLPVAIADVRRRTGRFLAWPPSPARTVDAYLITFTVLFSLLYVLRLPIHAQITVRYLLPIFPVLAVLIVRLPAIRAVLAGYWHLMLWTYAVAVLVGGQLFVVALVFVDPGVGEAFQFHAWIGLAVAAPLAVWSLTGRHEGWWGRIGAVLVGLAAAAVTVFLLMVTLDYFTVSNSQALPLVRAIADVVSIV